MAKDPAFLIYINDFLTATAGMDADAVGWYLRLILHQADKGGLPNDEESLAVLAGVKFSQYQRFQQVLEQVLKQKFTVNEETGLLENEKASNILKSREEFKDKRQRSGNIGVVIKMAKNITGYTKRHIESLKTDLFSYSEEQIERAKSEQVLKQMLKLYRNENEDENKDINEIEKYKEIARLSFSENSCPFGDEFKKQWLIIIQSKKWRTKEQSAVNASLKKLMEYEEPFAQALVERSIGGGYQGVTYENTDINYQKYLKSKNGTAITTTANAIESRASLVAAASLVLSQRSA